MATVMKTGTVANDDHVRAAVSDEEWAIRVDLAAAYRLVALYGWDDLIFTHLSARVPGPEHHFLINPYDMMFEEITASSLVKIDVEGHELQVLEGLFSNGNQFKIRLIQLESHNDDMYLSNSKHGDIDQLLNKNGYFEIAKIKHGFGDFAEIIYEYKNK